MENLLNKFRLGEALVDVDRCHVTSPSGEHTVEPKVMDVLQYLYQHRNTVVSQETIFSAVWPKAIFNPSSVQRCIALLRKVLGDDAKNPHFIITHPKRGYSLSVDSQQSSQRRNVAIISVIAVCIIVVISLVLSFESTSIKTQFSQLRPIPSVHGSESNMVLAPNGDNVAFIKASEKGDSLWIKSITSGEDLALMADGSDLDTLGWHPDGTAVAYVKTENDRQILGYITLDPIHLQPVQDTVIVEIADARVAGHQLFWSETDMIYYVDLNPDTSATRLMAINIKTTQQQVVLESTGQDWLLLHALSPDETTIALAYESGQNQYRVDTLTLATGATKTLVTVEDGIQGLSWHPSGDNILLSRRHQLVTVNMNGVAETLNFNNYDIIRDAVYHPSGQEIIMELVDVDVDIMGGTPYSTSVVPLVDTPSVDFLPIFSPDASRFVFESHRSGSKQLYLYANGQQTLLFSNPDNEEFFGMVWSPSGEHVIAAAKDKLYRINVANKQWQAIPHQHRSFYLQQAFHHQEAILVSYRGDDGTSFHPARFDLTTGQLDSINANGERLSCYSMSLDDDDQIYFSNHNTVYRYQNFEAIPVWQSKAPGIIGVRVWMDTLTITLEHELYYQFVYINTKTMAETQTKISKQPELMLINASHDTRQLLYLTRPQRKRSLVRLF